MLEEGGGPAPRDEGPGPFDQILLSFFRWHQRATWTRPTTLGRRGYTPPALGGPRGPSCTIQTLPQHPGSPWAQ